MDDVKCSRCSQVKKRIAYKYYGKAKQYIDDNGKMWKGRICPDCYRLQHKLTMRKVRGSNLTARSCGTCHESFVPRRGHQKFCSKDCRRLDLNARRRKKPQIK